MCVACAVVAVAAAADSHSTKQSFGDVMCKNYRRSHRNLPDSDVSAVKNAKFLVRIFSGRPFASLGRFHR